jgi:hypothetical protein
MVLPWKCYNAIRRIVVVGRLVLGGAQMNHVIGLQTARNGVECCGIFV